MNTSSLHDEFLFHQERTKNHLVYIFGFNPLKFLGERLLTWKAEWVGYLNRTGSTVLLNMNISLKKVF